VVSLSSLKSISPVAALQTRKSNTRMFGTQFCVINKNGTESGFDACVSVLVGAQNQTLGILGCQGLESETSGKSGGVRVERGFMVWFTVAVLPSGVLLS